MNVPFPGGVKDGDVYFHKDSACYYHEELNTWECRKIDITSTSYTVTAKDVATQPIPLDPAIGSTAVTAPGAPTIEAIGTQFEANWYLAYAMQQNLKRIVELEARITELEADDLY